MCTRRRSATPEQLVRIENAASVLLGMYETTMELFLLIRVERGIHAINEFSNHRKEIFETEYAEKQHIDVPMHKT